MTFFLNCWEKYCIHACKRLFWLFLCHFCYFFLLIVNKKKLFYFNYTIQKERITLTWDGMTLTCSAGGLLWLFKLHWLHLLSVKLHLTTNLFPCSDFIFLFLFSIYLIFVQQPSSPYFATEHFIKICCAALSLFTYITNNSNRCVP